MKKTFLLLFALLFTALSSLNAQWTQTGGPNGGSAYDLETIDDEIWAGTANGLYKSNDNGES